MRPKFPLSQNVVGFFFRAPRNPPAPPRRWLRLEALIALVIGHREGAELRHARTIMEISPHSHGSELAPTHPRRAALLPLTIIILFLLLSFVFFSPPRKAPSRCIIPSLPLENSPSMGLESTPPRLRRWKESPMHLKGKENKARRNDFRPEINHHPFPSPAPRFRG